MNRYFDCNATTPMSDAARRAWLEATEKHWHNPSSLYHDAGFAKQKLEEARERLATLLGCDAGRIVFTSGATESNNALFASLAARLPTDARVAISTIEHPSVREAAHTAFRRVIEIPVNAAGVVEPCEVSSTIERHSPALVSVMAASNESGALQPWSEIAELCRARGVPFHTDAAQWLGKLPCSGIRQNSEASAQSLTSERAASGGTLASSAAEASYVTGSAHKFGGPKGTGFLVLSDEDESLRFIRGGPQENGRRAGTENYPAVEAMVTALEDAELEIASPARRQIHYRDRFVEVLRDHFPDLRVISEDTGRLWNTALLVMPRHENLKWLTRLSRRGFSISTGSACSSGKEGSSVVVQALGASPEELKRVLRISGGWHHTEADWRALAEAFVEVDKELAAGGRPVI